MTSFSRKPICLIAGSRTSRSASHTAAPISPAVVRVRHNADVDSFTVAEAKTRLAELLERVSNGEEILLTRRGDPLARIVPVERLSNILGAGRQDPNINKDVIASDEWWNGD